MKVVVETNIYEAFTPQEIEKKEKESRKRKKEPIIIKSKSTNKER